MLSFPKILSLLMCLALLGPLCSEAGLSPSQDGRSRTEAALSPSQDGLAWSEAAEGVTITGYNGAGGKLTIPAALNGKPVIAIGDGAFQLNGSITEIVLPGSVQTVGSYAFALSASLNSVTVEGGLDLLGNFAFAGCSQLASVQIDGPVEVIGKSAFAECSKLTRISIADHITEIGDTAFANCAALPANLNLFEGMKRIGASAFSGCTSLSTLRIPVSVEQIGPGLTRGCSESLILLVAPGSYAESWCRENGVAYSLTGDAAPTEAPAPAGIPEGLVYETANGAVRITGYNGSAKELVIPDQIDGCPVTAIAENAFEDCTWLVSVTLPDTVVSVESFAFGWCSSLERVDLPDGLDEFGSYVFTGCKALRSIRLPAGVSNLYGNPFSYCTALETIEVAEGNPDLTVTDGVLFGKGGRELVCYPLGLARDSYTVPEGTQSLAPFAFSDCSSLTSLVLPESLTEIGFAALQDCTGLTGLTIPAAVTSIEDSAFENVGAVFQVTAGSYAESWCRENGISCTALEPAAKAPETGIPAAGTTLDGLAYEITGGEARITGYTGQAAELTIPERIDDCPVTGICADAFSGCRTLTSIRIPATVAVIEDRAFADVGATFQVPAGSYAETWCKQYKRPHRVR